MQVMLGIKALMRGVKAKIIVILHFFFHLVSFKTSVLSRLAHRHLNHCYLLIFTACFIPRDSNSGKNTAFLGKVF